MSIKSYVKPVRIFWGKSSNGINWHA